MLDHLQLLLERIERFAFVHGFTLARRRGNLQFHTWLMRMHFFTLLNSPIVRVSKDHFFTAMQQGCCSRIVMGFGRVSCNGMRQTRVRFHADVRLHANLPLAALLGLVDVWVAYALVVLGRAGRRNQRGIHLGYSLEHQATVNQFGVDCSQGLLAQLILFKQMAKAQYGALTRQAGDARIQVRKPTIQRNFLQGHCHG
jgi:hypothetical protein